MELVKFVQTIQGAHMISSCVNRIIAVADRNCFQMELVRFVQNTPGGAQLMPSRVSQMIALQYRNCWLMVHASNVLNIQSNRTRKNVAPTLVYQGKSYKEMEHVNNVISFLKS